MTRLGAGIPQPRGPLRTSRNRFPFRAWYPVTRQGAPASIRTPLSYLGTTRTTAPTFSGRPFYIAITREGTGLFPRGPLGTNFTRTSIAPTQVNLTTAHMTFTPVAFSMLQDTIIEFPSSPDESFTAGATFTVVQNGNLVQLTTADLTFTPTVGGQGFSVLQTNPNDHTIFLPTAHMTFTPIAFSVVYQNQVQFPTTHLTYTGIPFDVNITLPGAQTLTQTDILAIWNNISITGYTPLQLLEIISAATAGVLDISKPGPGGVKTYEFKAVDGSKKVITAVADPQGQRLTVTITT